MYDKSGEFSGKAYTFGKEQPPGVGSIVPGPGAYDEKDSLVKSGSKKATIGTGQRGAIIDGKLTDMPGPGMYDKN